MSDKLQQFIDNNRDAFDAAEPQPQVWNSLQQKLNSRGSLRLQVRKTLLWAASFAAVAVLSITIYSLFQKNGPTPIPSSTAGEPAEFIDLIDPIQARQITQYHEIIELKQSELRQQEKEQPELYREFITDINSLDSAYSVLKAELPDNPNREILLEAMINNLQLQSDLLSRHLLIIKEIKQKNKGHEKQVI